MKKCKKKKPIRAVSQVYEHGSKKGKFSEYVNRAYGYYLRNGLVDGAIHSLKSSIFGYIYYSLVFRKRSFVMGGKKYPYFCHRYNHTWLNERAVEISVVKSLLKENKGKEILEVGNVLSYYMDVSHDVVDKYESGQRIISCDIADFKPEKKYDLILCVSTLEHIGYDERPRNPKNLILAVKKMQEFLKPTGKIFVTLPLGHNSYLDNWLKTGDLRLSKMSCMKRISRGNVWEQTEYPNILGSKYNSPFRAANGLVMGFIGKK